MDQSTREFPLFLHIQFLLASAALNNVLYDGMKTLMRVGWWLFFSHLVSLTAADSNHSLILVYFSFLRRTGLVRGGRGMNN